MGKGVVAVPGLRRGVRSDPGPDEGPSRSALTPPDDHPLSDRLEILSVDLLERAGAQIASFRRTAERLGIDLGWHYVLDLAWVAENLGDPRGRRILDAGAGTGVLQWWLAERGADVVSADRLDRRDLSFRFRARCRVTGLRPEDLTASAAMIGLRLSEPGSRLGSRLAGGARAAAGTLAEAVLPKWPGRVRLFTGDLADLRALGEASVDAVVSVSALEHNEPDRLGPVVDELMRALKPDGVFLATVAAARDEDWYHQPSRGWCFTEATLRKAFRMPAGCPSNFEHFDDLFARLRGCQELRSNLAAWHFRSGDNGMPWGVWDPKYQPVGVFKRK